MTTRGPWHFPFAGAIALLLCGFFGGCPWLQAESAVDRVAVRSRVAGPPVSAIDSGRLPGSQMLALTLRLDPGAQRAASLDNLIAEQLRPGSPRYRQWLSPDQFAKRFGATDAQIATVSAWLGSSGLAVVHVSPSKMRLTVTGSSALVEAAFAVQLRQYRSGSVPEGSQAIFFANAEPPSVPAWIAPLIADVSGLDTQPPATPMKITPMQSSGGAMISGTGIDPLTRLEAIVDDDAASILSIEVESCETDLAPSDLAPSDTDDWRAVLKQAATQGITVLATGGCPRGAFPAALPEVTAVVAADAVPGAAASVGVAPRPEWQFAPGLPAGDWREVPDLAVTGGSSAAREAALAATLAAIESSAGTRLGNVAPVLYQLAASPGLFSQPDGAAAGVWERATGLGVVDLKRLRELFPAGAIGTSSLLSVSNYAPYHGQPLTLIATVTSTGGSGVPTGTVTFASTQKGTLGTATLNASGEATFISSALQAGTYTTTSVYSGDANYSGSTSGVATITILGELSLISATVEPGAAVGGNATIDVSVTSSSGVGTPSGTVTVAPQGTANPATATATLAGTNGTATARVPLPVYQAGQFTLLVSCSDPDPSFTCYSPVSIQMTVAKGATATVLGVSPASPGVGQAYTLTATVSGTGGAAASVSAARRTGSEFSGFGLTGDGRVVSRSSSAPLAMAAYTGPTGNVQLMDGAQYLATVALASGMATYTGNSTTATHSFTAMYSGDANYGTSSSNSPTTSGATPTSTAISASASSIGTGQSITFTANVASAGVPPTMTGTVTFTAAAQGVLGTALVSKGVATLTLATLSAGSYSVTASYSGDSVFAPSVSAPVVIAVVALPTTPTTTAVTSNVASVLSGVQVLLTATVTGSAAGPLASTSPSGKVSFYDTFGGVLSGLGSAMLVGNGANTSVATLSIMGLAAGTHSIYAVYAGDSIYLGSTSAAIPLGSTGYAVTFVPTTMTLNRGQTGQATLTVNFQGGLAGTVSFGCTPPPNIELTCSFNPTVLNAAGTTTLTVGTVAPSSASAGAKSEAKSEVNPPGSFGIRLAAGASLATLLLWIRPRRLSSALFLLIAIAMTAGATGCGGTNLATSPPTTPSDPGTSLGTQILAITTAGSDGTNTVRHDFQYQVTVQ